MISKIEFSAKNLTSNAGVLPLFNYTKNSGILQYFDENFFESNSLEKVKTNHIKALLCAGFIGVDRLERFALMRNDPQYSELGIDIKSPEAISRHLKNYTFKTNQKLRDISFKVAIKLIKKAKLSTITIDIDSRSVNVEGNQEGAVKGYNPERKGNNCYNILMAFCDELKCFISGFMRSGDTYTSNGTAELIKEIIANLNGVVDKIIFRMDCGYFSEEIIETIENAGHYYVIKAKNYSNMVQNAHKGICGEWKGTNKQYAMSNFKPDKWKTKRKFAVMRELKSEKERQQLTIDDTDNYDYFFFANNMDKTAQETQEFYQKRGNAENYIKETKYDMNIGSLKTNSFCANEAFFQLMMIVYNIFLLFKFDKLKGRYREQIKTFRFMFVHIAGKIIKTGRQTILQISENYPYKEIFCL